MEETFTCSLAGREGEEKEGEIAKLCVTMVHATHLQIYKKESTTFPLMTKSLPSSLLHHCRSLIQPFCFSGLSSDIVRKIIL